MISSDIRYICCVPIRYFSKFVYYGGSIRDSTNTDLSRHILDAFQYIDEDLKIRSLLYIGCGTLVCISSSVTIFVFSFKDFRRKYIMFLALSVGDLINGLSFLVAGIFRNMFMFNGQFFIKVTSMQCIFNTPWAVLMIFAGQFPAFINLFIASERTVALEFPGWYRKNWRDDYKTYLVLLSVGLTLIFLLVAVIVDRFHVTTYSSRICAVMNATGIIFGTVHYTLISATYLFCLSVLVIVFRKTNKRRQPTKDELRRQRMMLAIAGISVILVSIPNLVLILNEWKVPEVNALFVGVLYCLYATHSGLSLFIYLIFRPDFRFRLLSSTGLAKILPTAKEPSLVQASTFKSVASSKVRIME